MTISIIKAILIIVILAVMVMVLLGINHLFAGNFRADRDDAEQLREDVETKNDVITDNNVFHELVNASEDKRSAESKKVLNHQV